MIIIGERINSTRKLVREAIRARDSAHIILEASRQLNAGARYIDVNCAVSENREAQDLDWVINVIQGEFPDAGISVDSPSILALESGLSAYKGKGGLVINSITADRDRASGVLPLAKKYGAKIIALCMDDKGMPSTPEERYDIAKRVYHLLKSGGIPDGDILFDPLVRPIATEPGQAAAFLKALPLIRSLGNVETICGLSNVSFGLPKRSIINSSFLAMAVSAGLSGAILDPTDVNIRSAIYASHAITGADDYCAGYLAAFRAGTI